CGELESTKSVSELYSPVSGTLVESNEDVIQNPERINEDPYGAAWWFTVDVSEEEPLLTPEQYAEQTESTVESEFFGVLARKCSRSAMKRHHECRSEYSTS